MTVVLSEQAKQALARFVIGFGTEDANRANYSLDFAGNITYDAAGDPVAVKPVGNSGYSLGSLQWDFGSRPQLADSFLGAYNIWAALTGNRVYSNNETLDLIGTLKERGPDLRATPTDALSKDEIALFNQFVSSDSGAAWVNLNIDRSIIGSNSALS
jgi:hypothetical protein